MKYPLICGSFTLKNACNVNKYDITGVFDAMRTVINEAAFRVISRFSCQKSSGAKEQLATPLAGVATASGEQVGDSGQLTGAQGTDDLDANAFLCPGNRGRAACGRDGACCSSQANMLTGGWQVCQGLALGNGKLDVRLGLVVKDVNLIAGRSQGIYG